MKRKKIIGLISLFMCVALVGVGFAAWVITGDAKNTTSGNVSVQTVTDERIQITEVALTAETIVFGAPSSLDDDKSWLKGTGAGTEVLTTTLSFKVKNNNQCKELTVTLAPSSGSATAYNGCIEKNLIVAPTNSGKQTIKVEEGTEATYTITYTWAWGSEFSKDGKSTGANPYTFYNGLAGGSAGSDIATERSTSGKTNADYALEALGTTSALGLAALNTATFDIVINAKSIASAS